MGKKRQINLGDGSPDNYIKEVVGESDRAAAIVAQASVEEYVRLALYLALGFEHARAVVAKDLIGDDDSPGILSFSYQAKLAYCLKIVSEADLRDLTILARIRNKFAHTTTHYSFDRDPVKGMCQALKSADEASCDQGPLTMRERYQMAGVIICIRIAKWFNAYAEKQEKAKAIATRHVPSKPARRKKSR